MFTDRTNQHLPFPEAIDRDDVPDRFDITVGQQSRTDLARGLMVVDTSGVCECGLDHARGSRLHEMGHVAWTPADWTKRVERAKDAPSPTMVNAAEDARITMLRGANRLPQAPPLLCVNKNEYQRVVEAAVNSGDLEGLVASLCASFNSTDQTHLWDAASQAATNLRDKGKEAEADIINKMMRKVSSLTSRHLYDKAKPSFRSSIALARSLTEAMRDALEEYVEASEVEEATKKTTVKKVKQRDSGETWGAMEIVSVPLTKQSNLGMERKWTARDEGPIPTRFDRWSIDKRVFRVKKRAKGAAVLVDVSGSMSWSEADLSRVLDEVPAATVAIYSGNGPSGKLVIVARKGRRAKWSVVKPHKMGGNVVDGPALEWLASQPETVKVWMSDGGITGPNDRHGNEAHMRRMERDVKRHMRRGGIMRVRDADSVMEVLSGKQRFVPDRNFRNPWGY